MSEYTVRRLTPLECERLQGFPNNWTNIGDWVDSKGKTHKGDSDSPRYKALGNSICGGENSLWDWVIKRISAQYDYRPTMASLFDGIGGFPLLWDSYIPCILIIEDGKPQKEAEDTDERNKRS